MKHTRPGGYPHHGKKHGLKLAHANDRRAKVDMAPVTTLTVYEREKKIMQRRERAIIRQSAVAPSPGSTP